ncbi:cation:proton antiporter [Limibaculum sp. FT325]|uniref:cation:proton antiporter n=1 Tax=Thermohalobaculum sediminis TaxID=2939436 RepID=UPI0020C061A6|nr:cation:proton antiporter [Limibaculum sediminis]MCL5777699.1 cation:proton antiporter [Limibaculum sediminis]
MDIVVFAVGLFALLMTLVALGVPLARALGLPFPVIVAASGIVYGSVALATGFTLSGSGVDNFDLWFLTSLAFDSQTLLYVFLPPLLFEMALAINVRRLLDDVAAVVLLAVLAVVVATAAVGLAVWGVSELGIVACLMLGAAVATTDPAAVVTTFREIGAPRRLMVLLEGESLLNDAAAIAIFTVLFGVAAQLGAPSASGAVTEFLKGFAGGAGVGLGVGYLASRLYPLLGRSAVAETSMTVALAYGAYLIADAGLGVSGVVAVVFAGGLTGSVGFVRMGPGNWTTVRAVWTQVGFWANGFVLLLVATLTPGLLAGLTWDKLLLVPAVYAGAFVARAFILFALLPLIESFTRTENMTTPQKVLVLWGGVRGAVTLVLALALTEIDALGTDAPVVGALAAAFTLVTLVLNASTLAFVTHRLGLDRLSSTDLAIRERIIAGSIERVRQVVTDLARRRALEEETIAVVEAVLAEQRREAEAAAGSQRIPFGERLKVGLAILGAQEGRLVRRAFEEGAIGPRVTNHMRLFAERLVDAARAEGRDGYEAAFERDLRAARAFRVAVAVQRLTGWDGPLRQSIEVRLTALLEGERILRDLLRFAEGTLAPMVGEDAAANLRELIAYRLERVEEEIEAVNLQYPSYVAEMERVLLLRAAVRRERQQFARLLHDGIIGQELHDNLAAELDRRERPLARPPRLDLALKPRDLVERVPLFQGLDARQRRAIARRLRTRLVAPEEVVLEAGVRGDTMFFIASGALEVRGEGEPVQLSNGDFFGEIALLSPMRRRRTSVVSLGFGRLLSLSRDDFTRLVRREPAIEATIRAAAARQLDLGFRGENAGAGRAARPAVADRGDAAPARDPDERDRGGGDAPPVATPPGAAGRGTAQGPGGEDAPPASRADASAGADDQGAGNAERGRAGMAGD